MTDTLDQLCIYSRGPKHLGFRFTGPSSSRDSLLLNIMGKWNAFSRVWEANDIPFSFPGKAFSDPAIAGAIRQCLFQAMVGGNWSDFSPVIRTAVANLPDVLTISQLQEWVICFAQQTGIDVKVGRALIVDPDEEWAHPPVSYDLVGYCALGGPDFPWPISSVFEDTDTELWESSLATNWMMLAPRISDRYAYLLPIEDFYWRHDSELRWWESFANGCFDELTELQKLASLLTSTHYLARDYLFVRVLKIV